MSTWPSCYGNSNYKVLYFYWCIIFSFVQVTGGSSGIGKCIALEAAKIGANVTIVARNKNRLRSALEEIKGQCLNNDQKFNYLSGTFVMY